jgi:vacuolar-type H+-ATPase subunit I/STV1
VVIYTCDRCGKSWDRKSSYVRHIKRKFLCKIIYQDTSISCEIANSINYSDKASNLDEINDELKKLFDLVNELIVGKDRMEHSMNKIIEEKEKLDNSMGKIIEENKKIRKSNRKMVKKIEALETKIVKNETKNIYCNNHIETIVNNINIIAHGREELKFLSNDQKLSILDCGFKSVQKFVQLIHMNPDKPEYSNIYVKNWKDSKGGVMINNGSEWIRCKNDIIDDLRDRGIWFVDLTHEYLKGKDLLPIEVNKKYGGLPKN